MSAPSSPETALAAFPMKTFSSEDAPILLFRFTAGAVIAVFDPRTGKGAATQANPVPLPDNWLEDTLTELGRHAPLDSTDTLVKLIGTAAAVSAIQSELSSRGVKTASTHIVGAGSNEVYFYTTSGRARVTRAAAAVSAIPAIKSGKVRALIVDDSKTIRDLLSKVLSSDPMIEVVATAEAPERVEDLIVKHRPDVITLDIHMPGMDGVTLLRQYLPKHPIPTVMISSISLQEGPMVLSALESGAVDYIQKPSFNELRTVAPFIIEKVKIAASAKVTPKTAPSPRARKSAPGPGSSAADLSRLIAIGSSTGGTEALRVLLSGLPDRIPPIAVVQHIPPVFSKAFAMRMNELFAFEVKEAEDGDEVRPDRVLIAPGGKQMSLKKKAGGKLVAVIDDGPPVNRHKPSVDVLFDSVVTQVGKDALGVILTGMGADGARGLLKLRQLGCRTVAQDEASCVVFGMPREAIRLEAAEFVEPLDQIASRLMRLLEERKGRKAA